jgi:hypothetical protein
MSCDRCGKPIREGAGVILDKKSFHRHCAFLQSRRAFLWGVPLAGIGYSLYVGINHVESDTTANSGDAEPTYDQQTYECVFSQLPNWPGPANGLPTGWKSKSGGMIPAEARFWPKKHTVGYEVECSCIPGKGELGWIYEAESLTSYKAILVKKSENNEVQLVRCQYVNEIPESIGSPVTVPTAYARCSFLLFFIRRYRVRGAKDDSLSLHVMNPQVHKELRRLDFWQEPKSAGRQFGFFGKWSETEEPAILLRMTLRENRDWWTIGALSGAALSACALVMARLRSRRFVGEPNGRGEIDGRNARSTDQTLHELGVGAFANAIGALLADMSRKLLDLFR